MALSTWIWLCVWGGGRTLDGQPLSSTSCCAAQIVTRCSLKHGYLVQPIAQPRRSQRLFLGAHRLSPDCFFACRGDFPEQILALSRLIRIFSGNLQTIRQNSKLAASRWTDDPPTWVCRSWSKTKCKLELIRLAGMRRLQITQHGTDQRHDTPATRILRRQHFQILYILARSTAQKSSFCVLFMRARPQQKFAIRQKI